MTGSYLFNYESYYNTDWGLVPRLALRPPCIAFSITSPYNIWVQNGGKSEKLPIKILKTTHSFCFVRL